MALNFTQLTTPVTRDEAVTDLINMLESVGFRATSWQETSIPRQLVHIGAHLYSKASLFWSYIATQAFIDTAEGEALTRLSASHYQNTRAAAIPTQIRGTFTTAAGEGPHSVDVGDVVISDALGHTYRNVAGLGIVYPVNLTSASAVTLLMEAEVAGSDHNVGDNTVTTMVTSFAGVTVTNDVGLGTTSIVQTGVDEESDETLEERDATKWATLAIESVRAGVQNVALGAASSVAKTKVDDNNPRGAGTADVYISAAAAVSGGADVAAVQTALTDRFFGNSTAPFRVQAVAASPLTLSLTGTVYYDSAFTSADVQTAVEAALLAFIKATPIGGWDYSPGPANVVRLNDLENVIKNALVGGKPPVKTVTLTVPSGDLAVGSFQVVIPPASYSLTYVAV